VSAAESGGVAAAVLVLGIGAWWRVRMRRRGAELSAAGWPWGRALAVWEWETGRALPDAPLWDALGVGGSGFGAFSLTEAELARVGLSVDDALGAPERQWEAARAVASTKGRRPVEAKPALFLASK